MSESALERAGAEAEALFRRALAANPGHVQARLGLIELARTDQRFAEALELLEGLPAELLDQPNLIAHRADLLGKLGRPQEEAELLRPLIATHPKSASIRTALASVLRTLGRSDEAAATLREAIALEPGYGKAWWLLSDLKDFRFGDEDIAAMSALLAGPLSDADRAPLHFALAKAHDDRGEAAEAFAHYDQGNQLRGAGIDPREAIVSPNVDRSIALFTAPFLEARANRGQADDAPIFIVGLPRSGSTLVEQILASHPAIEGTFELPIMPQIVRQLAAEGRRSGGGLFTRIAALDAAEMRTLGQTYLDRAAAYRRSDRPRFIDKLPGNWTNIGLIRLILPQAKIIDARRHPLAVGFSNFKQNFAEGGQFAYRLDTIGRFYRDYLRLVTHFEQIAPGAVHRVVNEDLIADFEPQVRALLDYVGVPFDPACLEFHRTERAVRTPSAAQVRRPINRDGVDQWRAFEPWLDELKQALGPALVGWNLPAGTYRDEEEPAA